jgi:hypothetical protein
LRYNQEQNGHLSKLAIPLVIAFFLKNPHVIYQGHLYFIHTKTPFGANKMGNQKFEKKVENPNWQLFS